MNTEAAVLARFRKRCLEMPETSEADSWGHPNFRAGKRIFAAFEWIKGRPSIAFHLGLEESSALLLQNTDFFATPYGKGKWVSLWADTDLDWELVDVLLEQAYRTVALKRMLAALEDGCSRPVRPGR